MRDGSSTRQPLSSFHLLFSLLLCLMCAWVLSLPEFPSQDGPMHVYLAHVFESLLRGKTVFSPFFYIRNLLPPYSLHYYLLILLTAVMSSAMAEKVIVCLIFLTLGFGFRFLAMACGRSGYLTSLFVLPLLLNWPLGMGFFNFCLSLGFAMWAMGFWWRAREDGDVRYLAAYLGMIVLLTLTHPVPLLLVLGVAGAELAVRTIFRWRSVGTGLATRTMGRLWGVYALSCTSLLYILHFTDRKRIEQNTSGSALTRPYILKRFALLRPVGLFAGSEWDNILYRAGLYAIVLGGIALGVMALRRARSEKTSFMIQNPWLWMALVFPIIVIVIPRDMNGSHFFSDRLLMITWFGSLLAASAHPVLSRRSQAVLAVLGTVMTLGVLGIANSRIRPLAVAIAAQRAQPFDEAPGSSGMLLGTPVSDAMWKKVYKVSFDPTFFIPAYAFAKTDTAILNSPWLDLPILPIATQPGMLNRVYPPAVLDTPFLVYLRLMEDDPGTRARLLQGARFLIYPDEKSRQTLTAGIPGADRWKCRPWAGGLICDQGQTKDQVRESGPTASR